MTLQSWGSHGNWDCTDLHQWLLLALMKPQWLYTASSILHPSCHQNQCCKHITKLGWQLERHPQPSLDHSLCVLTPRKHFLKDFTSVMKVSCLITPNSPVPVEQKLQILNSKDHTHSVMVISASPWNIPIQASIVCIALSLIRQVPTEQHFRLWAFDDFSSPKFRMPLQSSQRQHGQICHWNTQFMVSISVGFL